MKNLRTVEITQKEKLPRDNLLTALSTTLIRDNPLITLMCTSILILSFILTCPLLLQITLTLILLGKLSFTQQVEESSQGYQRTSRTRGTETTDKSTRTPEPEMEGNKEEDLRKKSAKRDN